VAFITATKMPPCYQHEEEKFFLNAKGQKEALPSIWDSPTKQLSVVVPSYNEEKRCKFYLSLFANGPFGKRRKCAVSALPEEYRVGAETEKEGKWRWQD
jgi:hypothetical protein